MSDAASSEDEQRDFERMEAIAAYDSISRGCDKALWALVDGDEMEVVRRLAIIRKRARNALEVYGDTLNDAGKVTSINDRRKSGNG